MVQTSRQCTESFVCPSHPANGALGLRTGQCLVGIIFACNVSSGRVAGLCHRSSSAQHTREFYVLYVSSILPGSSKKPSHVDLLASPVCLERRDGGRWDLHEKRCACCGTAAHGLREFDSFHASPRSLRLRHAKSVRYYCVGHASFLVAEVKNAGIGEGLYIASPGAHSL